MPNEPVTSSPCRRGPRSGRGSTRRRRAGPRAAASASRPSGMPGPSSRTETDRAGRASSSTHARRPARRGPARCPGTPRPRRRSRCRRARRPGPRRPASRPRPARGVRWPSPRALRRPGRPRAVALEAMATAHPVRVEVATPGGAVLVDEHVDTETVAAVKACPRQRAGPRGPDAEAWILAEAREARSVSVRDDGPGIPPGRLEEAAAEGRLGVSSSIRGRMGTSAAPPPSSAARGHRVGADGPASVTA